MSNEENTHLAIEKPLIAKEEWHIAPDLCFLNHGSFGACPKDVLHDQERIRLDMERSLVRFNLTQLPTLIQSARESIAPLIGASPESFVFVNNASEGVATALNCIDWHEGDEVIISQDSYPACKHMLTQLVQRYGLVLKEAKTPFGDDDWQTRVVDAFKQQCTQRTRLILIDHITSPTALIYPIKLLVQLAKKIGAISLVDGAHAPGQLALDLENTLAPDFYTGNTHKWVMTPKSAAILYVSPKWKTRITPLVISHGYLAQAEQRFHALFDWTGTRDYSAIACIPKTIEWVQQRCGGFMALRMRNNELLRQARSILIDRLWGIQAPSHPPVDALGHMAAILLPPKLAEYPILDLNLTENTSAASADAIHPLQIALWAQGYEVPIIRTIHGVMLRISAQAYNDLSQYRSLADTLVRLSKALN